MRKLTFVIGGIGTGKTHFIKEHFGNQDVDILNVYDYQQRAYDEAGFKDVIPVHEQYRCLAKANEMHLHDIVEHLDQGRDVVAEQTFYKAKRRIAYIDAVRRATDAEIEVYVMCSSDERWEKNLKERGSERDFEQYREQVKEEFEFPNPTEGFDAIYEVVDGEIHLRMDPLISGLLEQARKELAEETDRLKKEGEEIRRRKELLDSMKTRPFWHYCEVCGKKEYVTAQEAFDNGWDYPPNIGQFGLLSPRTCGDCRMQDTLWWHVNNDMKVPLPIVMEGMLKDEERITWRRIKAEPESLLEEETEEVRRAYLEN